MLVELHIKDFAIINEVHLEFGEGFNVITGETGAGKSILIDAVNFVLGVGGGKDFIRSGAQQTTVEASFRVPEVLQSHIQSYLDEEAIEYDSLAELHLSREYRSNGRNVARVNGSVCKVTTYREIGDLLLDIHGQNEHLSLLNPRQHIYLLDRFAELENDRLALTALVRKFQGIHREMEDLQHNEAELARRMDILQYQIDEIQNAKLRADEEDELREESNRLANAEKLRENTLEIERLLFGNTRGTAGAVEQISQTALLLEKAVKFDAGLQELSELADTITIQVEEFAQTVRRYAENIDLSPGRIDEVEIRLQQITSLKRKYGGSIEAVLEFAEKATRELDSITHSEERLAELEIEANEFLHQIGDAAIRLSQRRKEASARLSAEIMTELKDLRMEAARFEVAVEQQEMVDGCYVGDQRFAFDTNGIDRVEFMISTNFGEPIMPLAKIASGGETARAMLALKNVLTNADHTPTLIFDEVDQGIGGRLGIVIGEKLWRLTGSHQVLCVTHLAQVASFADTHFKVTKHVSANRTVTNIERLYDSARVEEITQMLGSETESARLNAHELLGLARQTKMTQQVRLL
ncbi:MAG: DNA repair protein RecN [Chloroflexi bacterium]|nr:DNA repair protein RecN [Chloroflexota bacterium]